LTATKAATALVSEPIVPPACGRLALSVWLKLADGAQPPLRMALEGRLAGKPYYRFAAVGAGANVPELAGEWRQFVFQVNDLPTAGLADLRVRFELTGPGSVFLDDVRLNDLEFTAAERLELSKIISLAEYRLQRGEIAACVRLLESYWPRFLTKYVPNGPTDVIATARVPHPRPAAPAATGSTPGMLDRLRKWPSWVR
jgi:hypothetical protein